VKLLSRLAVILSCIYTRKSSEEGLEQSFNSLQAQREACEAYIASRRHEGWQVVAKKYDDGGFSGGNMNRADLKQLLEDIAARLVDTVVVNKVDRLTRLGTSYFQHGDRTEYQWQNGRLCRWLHATHSGHFGLLRAVMRSDTHAGCSFGDRKSPNAVANCSERELASTLRFQERHRPLCGGVSDRNGFRCW
jgi:hypothetical protein